MRRIKKIEIALFAIGLGVFVFLAFEFGIGALYEHIKRSWSALLLVCGLWVIIYLLTTLAWWLLLGDEKKRISFGRFFLVNVSGFAINFLTPVMMVGGDPYKMYALSSAMGTERSVSVVILYRLIHILGHIFAWLTAIILALFLVSLSRLEIFFLVLIGAGLLALVVLLIWGHRKGIFQRTYHFLRRFKLLRSLLEKVQAKEQTFVLMDQSFTHAYLHRRDSFWNALLLEYLSRFLMGLEVYLLLTSINVTITLVEAFFLYAFYSLLINLLFFMPFHVGSREGGFYLALQSLALPPMLCVYVGVVMRIRELFWIFLGLAFLLITGGRKKKGILYAKEENVW